MADILLRKRQLALRPETTKGTYETALDTDGTAVTHANFNLVNPSWTPGNLLFDRNIRHATLSPFPQFSPGVATITLTHSVEITGHSDSTSDTYENEAPIGPLLTACGFESVIVNKIKINSWTTGSAFEHGETVTGGTSGATATIVGDVSETFTTHLATAGDTRMFIDESSVSGTFQGENLIGTDSGVIAVGDAGEFGSHQGWQLSSDDATVDTLSGVYYEDGVRIKFKGARGNVVFNFEHGKPPIATFTWTAIIHDIVDGALLTSTLIKDLTPPAVLGIDFRTTVTPGTTDIFQPTFNAMAVDMGMEVVLREDSSDADGYTYATIVGRAPTLTINPDKVVELNNANLHDEFHNGTNSHIQFIVGTTALNIWEFRIPSGQITGLSDSDRDAVSSWDVTYALNGGIQSSLQIGADSEITIVNR